MDENEKKPVTAATRTEPAEEFIDMSNQPSVPKTEAEKGVQRERASSAGGRIALRFIIWTRESAMWQNTSPSGGTC